MESTADEKALASCEHLAPENVVDDTCHRQTTTPHDENEDSDEQNTKEEDAASNLTRSSLNPLKREKPLFTSGTELTPDGSCVPLKLCDGSEDSVPYTINRYLRDYQREGIRFIYNNYSRSRGCILGDDMGLGKTVQVLGFLAAALHKKGTWEDIERNKPHFLQSQTSSKHSRPNRLFLIVAPLSVLYNWKDELDTWGYFQYAVVHGLRKQEELARVKKGRVEITLTTYETLRLFLTQFNNINWSAVFVDEAHKIKNPNSQITQAMKGLKCQIRFGLTGTILQNNLEELWCVMDWAVPGCLGSLGHFKNKVSDPIERGQRHSATKRDLATARKTVRDLVKSISYYFLRRTKTLIKDQLPKKVDRVVYCSLTDFQQMVYQTVLDTEDVQLILRSSENCDCQSGNTRRKCCYKTNSEGIPAKALYFTYLTVLRKVASHVALLQSATGTSKKQEQCASAICKKVFQKFPNFVQRCTDEAFEALSDPLYSGKMKVLQKLIRFYLQKKDKVLLFSLSTKILDILERYFMAEGHDYSRLDGTTKAKERVHIVKQFNTSDHINLCLVSTMAGGLGLNFVGANVVILFDPTWNPANDLQAIDRAYRIGQCRDVTVFRLISLGTVEEITYLRQVYKQQLQSSVVGMESARRYFDAVQGTHKGELFGINNLFRLQTQGTCLTRKILEREGQVEAGVMTTSAHTNMEAMEKEGKMHLVSEAADASEESMGASKIPEELLDFSSGSDDDVEEEHGSLSRIAGTKRIDSSAGPDSNNLLQHLFATLLQRLKTMPESGEDNTSSGSDDGCAKRESHIGKNDYPKQGRGIPINGNANLGQNLCRTNLEESDEDSAKSSKYQQLSKAHRFDNFSDESDDLDINIPAQSKGDILYSNNRQGQKAQVKNKCNRKRSTTKGAIFSEKIESFTTSEEDNTTIFDKAKLRHPKDAHVSGTSPRECKVATFTSVKNKTIPASRGTIDAVLGGLQEVAFTHSNQRVIGGSKAEELISRAAAKDVFEHKMYSQLPANELLTPCKALPERPLHCHSSNTPKIQELPKNHTVTFKKSIVEHTRYNTFILGETPLALRRHQLQEMASKLNFPSAHQFATDVLRSDYSQRLAWLRGYYASLGSPELGSFVTSKFPPADGDQTQSPKSNETTRRKSNQKCPEPKKKKRKSQRKLPNDIVSLEPEERKEEVSHARSHRSTKKTSVDGLGGCQTSSSSCSDPQKMDDTPFSMTQTSATNVQHHSQEVPSQEQSCLLTELLGDTSILDDLLKPKSKHSPVKTSTSELASPPPSRTNITSGGMDHHLPQRSASRVGRKDFWDILNEDNEERINKLTDLDEVRRLCIDTNLAARAPFVEKDSTNLWKTNDKFLWKK
ncbi:DNA excision repair protein ERCC-6-like 2 isoform X1 [Stigmatopora nigra]